MAKIVPNLANNFKKILYFAKCPKKIIECFKEIRILSLDYDRIAPKTKIKTCTEKIAFFWLSFFNFWNIYGPFFPPINRPINRSILADYRYRPILIFT